MLTRPRPFSLLVSSANGELCDNCTLGVQGCQKQNMVFDHSSSWRVEQGLVGAGTQSLTKLLAWLTYYLLSLQVTTCHVSEI
jgi:hypothetical protein